MKKWFKPTIVFVCAAMLLAGCQFSPSNQTKQQEITVWSFTDEAGYAIEKFEQKYPDIKVNFVNIPGNFYITKLKSALQTTSKAPDVFMIENANIRELIDVPYLENLSASPYNANELIEEQYAFVQANEKDSEGNVRAIGYQGTPGGIYYRRDLAKKYLGTDDPEQVGSQIDTWEKIFEIGEKVQQLSGNKVHALANWNAISNSYDGIPWVKDGKLVIDPTYLEVLDLVREARERNVLAEYEDGSAGYAASMQKGEVMFYPGATWALQYTFKANAPDTEGMWGLAQGPSAFSAGGTYIAMYSKSDKKDLAWKFIEFYNFDHDFLSELAKEQDYFTSNMVVNDELAQSLSSSYLGGQKHFEFFSEAAKRVPVYERTKYDATINNDIYKIVLQLYLNKDIQTKEEVVKRIKRDVTLRFPELEVD
ncbi:MULTISPECIES: ABC transporter substrate-binding protein [unclassified Paenibacillus]|uniref:ABC transporter substrate-binding protein n=1 Tax=unclassified Paenibacillus TaxID=185978 RepID=UPI0025A29155|nr:extracellular solute-binding protein [Paenibacillus sp. PK1-4R]WJM10963.1 extracellular solute-binding protein [Paenibacillus sp. PK1-4R]